MSVFRTLRFQLLAAAGFLLTAAGAFLGLRMLTAVGAPVSPFEAATGIGCIVVGMLAVASS